MMIIELTFDNRINSIEAVQKAIYRVLNNVDFDLKVDGPNIEVKITILNPDVNGKKLVAEMKRCVNDYSLREKISSQTADLRNLILATAFSRIIDQNKHEDEPIQ